VVISEDHFVKEACRHTHCQHLAGARSEEKRYGKKKGGKSMAAGQEEEGKAPESNRKKESIEQVKRRSYKVNGSKTVRQYHSQR